MQSNYFSSSSHPTGFPSRETGFPSSSSYAVDPADLAGDDNIYDNDGGADFNDREANMYGMTQEEEARSGGAAYRQVHAHAAGGNNAEGSPDSSPSALSHQYGTFVGYCFTVNYILGVGVLGMPYAFYRGGYILSPLCLGLVTIMATFTSLWLVDVSLRAQYIKRTQNLLYGQVSPPNNNGAGQFQAPSIEGGGGSDRVPNIMSPVSSSIHHRYEMNELTEMFLGLRARRFYELLVIIYLVGALWSYSSVFSSSLASQFGLPGVNHGDKCDIDKDHSSGCKDLYLAYMGIFSLIVVPLTCLDLTEMKLLQIILAIFRFVSLGTMMATSIAAIYSYRNPDPESHSVATSAPYYSDIKAFGWSNLGLVFPIAIYSQIFHHSVPGLSYPLKEKKAAPRIFTGVLVTTMSLYTALGIIVSVYYGGSIEKTCTLAWANYTGGHDAPDEKTPNWAKFIGGLVVLFPPIDIISAFPLNAITLGNNLLCAFIKDEVKQQQKKYKLPFRLLAATPPIIGAMIVRDLDVILKYTGCIGVGIAFVYPVFLARQSKLMCERMAIVVQEEEQQQAASSPAGGSVQRNGYDDHYDNAKSSKPFLTKYNAPTYNGWIINHPIAIWVVFTFSVVGLISVIVLSSMGLSD